MINTTNTMANTMANVTENNFDNLVAGQSYLFYGKFPVIKSYKIDKSDKNDRNINNEQTVFDSESFDELNQKLFDNDNNRMNKFEKEFVEKNTSETGETNTYTIETTEVLFRANFIDIITGGETKTLRLDNVYCEEREEINQCGVLTLPLDWITKAEIVIQSGNIFNL